MDYPVQLSSQLQQLLKSLRKSRDMTQAELAQRLGVVQSRVADIERDPGAVSVEQLLQVLAMLGAQMVVRENAADLVSTPATDLSARATSRSTASATLTDGPKPKKSPRSPRQGPAGLPEVGPDNAAPTPQGGAQRGANVGTTSSPKRPPDDEPRGQW